MLKAGAQTVLPFPLDTSSIQSVNSFCDAVLSSTPNGIDIILSAAAEIHTNKKSIQTPDGIDQSFATNHLGLHVLLRKLEPSILAKTKEQYNRGLIKPRIVIIGSRLETKGSTLLSIETLKTSNGSQLVGEATTYGRRLQQSTYEIPILSPMDRYAATKFSNMLLAQSLYDRWNSKTTSSSSISSASSSASSSSSPSIFVLTPGMVNTGLWRHFPTWYRILTYPLRAVALRSTEEAAMGVLYACTAMEAEDIPVANSYVYLSDGVSIEPSVPARNEKLAEQLFQVCDDLMNNRKEQQQQQQQIKETDSMPLICKTCGHEMVGDFEARAHVDQSGHNDFVMKE